MAFMTNNSFTLPTITASCSLFFLISNVLRKCRKIHSTLKISNPTMSGLLIQRSQNSWWDITQSSWKMGDSCGPLLGSGIYAPHTLATIVFSPFWLIRIQYHKICGGFGCSF